MSQRRNEVLLIGWFSACPPTGIVAKVLPSSVWNREAMEASRSRTSACVSFSPSPPPDAADFAAPLVPPAAFADVVHERLELVTGHDLGHLAGGQQVVDPLAIRRVPPLDLDGEAGGRQRLEEVEERTGDLGVLLPVGVVGHARRLGTERLQDGRDALPVADPGRADRGQAGEDLRQVGLEHALGHADDPGRALDPQRDVDRGAGARAVALRLAGAGEPEVFGRPGVAPRVGPVHEADDAPLGIADRQQQAGLAGDRQGAVSVAVEAGHGQEPRLAELVGQAVGDPPEVPLRPAAVLPTFGLLEGELVGGRVPPGSPRSASCCRRSAGRYRPDAECRGPPARVRACSACRRDPASPGRSARGSGSSWWTQ